ncbi:MAG: small-conductance mechanosensitive channel [Myxococcota bacterium]|jgi:small-conductance mechanosensitive channel
MIDATLDAILPSMPSISPGMAGLLLVALGVTAVLAQLLDRARSRLRASGLLPWLALVAAAALRVVALLCALGLVFALMPAALARATPWVLIAGALAIGWTARDGVRDMFAWAVLVSEGQIRPDRQVTIANHTGRVERLTLRAVWLADEHGGSVVVPNRHVLTEPAQVRPTGAQPVVVELRLPSGMSLPRVRERIDDAVRRVPWATQGPVALTALDDGRWQVALHAHDARFADTVRTALIELLAAPGDTAEAAED